MTNGQIAQLQELRRCYIVDEDDWRRVNMYLIGDDLLSRWCQLPKAWLRRLTHQYRHQIKAMKKNRKDKSWKV